MMSGQDFDYWQRQSPTKLLFPDIAWSRPEQRSQAGRLGIIGGNKLGFAAVADSYTVALETGIGYARVLLPDALRHTVPAKMTDVVFAPTNQSGSLSRDATASMLALASWSNIVLCVGDAGRNSETAIAYETFFREYTGPVILTRDVIDLVKNSAEQMVNRPQTAYIASFAQIQKLFQMVYYPKILTFSMHLAQFVEALHKFTITYPIVLTVLHQNHVITAHGGQVTSTAWETPMTIWRGTTATRASVYWAWNPSQPLAAITTSLAA